METTSLNKVSWSIKNRLEKLFNVIIEYTRNYRYYFHPSLGGSSSSAKLDNLKKYILNLYLVFDYNNGELFTNENYKGICFKNDGDSTLYYINYNNDLNNTEDYGDLRDLIKRIPEALPLTKDASFNKDLLLECIHLEEASYTGILSLVGNYRKVSIQWDSSSSPISYITSFSDCATNEKEVFVIKLEDFLREVIIYLINNGFVFTFQDVDNEVGYTIKTLSYLGNNAEFIKIGFETGFGFSFYDVYNDLIDKDIYYLAKLNITPTLTPLGIGTRINTNLLARDFQSAKAELINFIGTNYPQVWNDFYNGSIGTIFLDILAYLHDILNNYIDRSQRESYPLTAQETQNLQDWLSFLGFQIPGVTSASTLLKVDLSSLKDIGFPLKIEESTGLDKTEIKIEIYPDINLVKGETFKLTGPNGLTYCYFPVDNDNTLEILNKEEKLAYFYVPLKEGELVVETFNATGEMFQSYKTKQKPVGDKSFLLFKTTNEGAPLLLKLVESYKLFDKTTNADGVYTFNADGSLVIYLGGNNYGLQPVAGDKFTLVYLKSNGDAGNSLGTDYFKDQKIPIRGIKYEYTGDIITQTYQTDIIEATILGNDSASGGAYVYVTPEIMPAFVGLWQANNRLVTEADYDYFLKAFESTQGGKIKAKAFLNHEFDNIDINANIIFIPSLIYSAENIYKEFNVFWDDSNQKKIYPPLIQELVSSIEEKKMITDRIEIMSGITQEILLKINLVTNTGINKEIIKTEIEKRIKEYFANLNFGDSGKLSDLYYIAESVLRENTTSPKDILENSVSIGWRYNKVYEIDEEGKYLGVFSEEELSGMGSKKTIPAITNFSYDGNQPIKALYNNGGYILIADETGGIEFFYSLISEAQKKRAELIFGKGKVTDSNLYQITLLTPLFNWVVSYSPYKKKTINTDNIIQLQ